MDETNEVACLVVSKRVSTMQINGTLLSTYSLPEKGDTVTVVGQADSKGVVTATRISEGAGGVGGFGGGFGAAAGGAPGATGGGGRNNQNGVTGTTVN
jgi:hypothetical protein